MYMYILWLYKKLKNLKNPCLVIYLKQTFQASSSNCKQVFKECFGSS